MRFSELVESAPPGMEQWIKDRKPEFKKRYGDRWQEVLYATAWKQHKEQGMSEGYLNEFAPSAGDEGDGEDPYRYPKPKSYRHSIDFFGQFEADHFDQEDMNDATGEFKGYWGNTQIAYFKFANPAKTGSNDPGMGWYYEPASAGNSNNASAAPAVDNSVQRKKQELAMINQFLKSGQTPKPGSQIHQLMKRHGMTEAITPDHKKAIKGMHQLSSDQYYGMYKFSKDVAGHDGKTQTNKKTDNEVTDKPFAYAYTDAEEKMIKGADPKAKKITSSKSEEPDNK